MENGIHFTVTFSILHNQQPIPLWSEFIPISIDWNIIKKRLEELLVFDKSFYVKIIWSNQDFGNPY